MAGRSSLDSVVNSAFSNAFRASKLFQSLEFDSLSESHTHNYLSQAMLQLCAARKVISVLLFFFNSQTRSLWVEDRLQAEMTALRTKQKLQSALLPVSRLVKGTSMPACFRSWSCSYPELLKLITSREKFWSVYIRLLHLDVWFYFFLFFFQIFKLFNSTCLPVLKPLTCATLVWSSAALF